MKTADILCKYFGIEVQKREELKQMWLSRIISLMVFAGTLLIISFIKDEHTLTFFVIICGVGLIGLLCVWFGDGLSWVSNYVYQQSSITPGGMFRFFGWILLLIPYVAIIVLKLT